MKSTLFTVALVLVTFIAIAVPAARADTGNEKVRFTVGKGDIELPGHVLSPGTYDMKFLDMEHHFVVVTSPAGAVGVFQVQPISRDKRTSNVKLEFAEPSKTAPERLMGFFYPDRKTGYEFLYPQIRGASALTASSRSHS